MQGAQSESCDGLDDNCDGRTDEDLGSTTCGTGVCTHTVSNCVDGNPRTCDPMQGAQSESCDGLDDNCDGRTDEDLGSTTCGLGACRHTVGNCVDGSPQNCDPMQGAQSESCDGLDDNCDGSTDEDLGSTTCGLGRCTHTVSNCVDGSPQACDPMQGARSESCDGLDDNCDGRTDEDLGSTTCGLGICTHTVSNCVDGNAQMCVPMQGAQSESCNGLDDNCDGSTDADDPALVPEACGLSAGVCAGAVHTREECSGGVWSSCTASDYGPDYEVPESRCDGKDNDCDGLTDSDGSGFGVTPCDMQVGVCAGSYHVLAECVPAGWDQCDTSRYGLDYEAVETRCDDKDNDCDGLTDECPTGSKCGGGGIAGACGRTSIAASFAAGGRHTCALDTDDRVRCWGANASGQLGDGTRIARLVATDVFGLPAEIKGLAAGANHTCAIAGTGAAWCWGSNSRGQLGDGSTADRTTPVEVSSLGASAVALAAGAEHTCAALSDGSVRCWGRNDAGQLGDGTTDDRLAPTLVSGLTVGMTPSISAGRAHTCAVNSTGGAVCWGANDRGQTGAGWLWVKRAGEDATNTVAPRPRTFTSAAYDSARARTVLFGGVEATRDTWEWDGTKWWNVNPGGSLPDGAYGGHTLAYDAERHVVLSFGGGTQVGTANMSPNLWAWDGIAWTRQFPLDPEGDGNPSARGAYPGLAFDDLRKTTVLFGGGYVPSCDGLSGFDGCGTTWEWDGIHWQKRKDFDTEGVASPRPRAWTAMAYDPVRHRSVVFGGWMQPPQTRFADTWEWDGSAWSEITPSDPEGDGNPQGRNQHQLVWDSHRRRVVLYGGQTGTSSCDGVSATACGTLWEWDGHSWARRRLAPPGPEGAPPPRSNGAVTHDSARDRFVLFGGCEQYCTPVAGDTWELHLPTSSRIPAPVADLTDVVSISCGLSHSCAVTGSGAVTCWGANDSGQLGDGTTTDRMAPIIPAGLGSGVKAVAAGEAHTCVLTAAGGAKCWGVNTDGQLGLGMTWAGHVAPEPGGTRIDYAASLFDAARNRIVTFASQWSNSSLMIWEHDGAGWSKRCDGDPSDDACPAQPSVRYGEAVAYDSDRRVSVLFGGYGPPPCDDSSSYYCDGTWEWDGRAWARRASAGGTPPPALYFHVMAYDSKRKRTVLYGGETTGGVKQYKTWEWDGSRWAWITPTDPEGDGDPTIATGGAMVFDERRGVSVLFGGEVAYLGGSAWTNSAETWEWDGSSWARRAPMDPEGDGNPSARQIHMMAYDSIRRRTVLFGGKLENGSLGAETWEWDGVSWARRSVLDPDGDGAPAAKAIAGMAFDATQGCTLLFGGVTNPSPPHTDVWEFAPAQAPSRSPRDVEWIGSGSVGLASGRAHTCARMASGNLKCWGRGADGELGDGSTDSTLTPRPVPGFGMVRVSAGSFWRGCNPGQPDSDPTALPYRRLVLSSFDVDVTEATRGSYRQCIDAGACTSPSCDWSDPMSRPDNPVACVSWDQARGYCAWEGKRLPSEAEWEKASRGADGRLFPWGHQAADCTRANAGPSCVGATAPVGSYPGDTSPYGVRDTGGNVSEWVADVGEPKTYYAVAPDANPTGPATTGQHVTRGGNFAGVQNAAALAYFRGGDGQAGDPGGDAIGFRCAHSLPEAPPSTMVRIPAGPFWRGCNEAVDTECQANEKPYRQIILSAFDIDATEVTQAEYQRCVGAGRCAAPSCGWDPANKARHPVVCVDWSQADNYCAAVGKRLPTEAQWEKAARGTDGTI